MTIIKMFIASSAFPFVVMFVILSIILQWKMPVIKGKYGERGLTQVDHIVTSVYGVFVIETKHYSGWIFGDEYKPYWTQVIYKKKTKMHNPIRQNYGHVQALLTYVGQAEMQDVHSILAFSPSSTFKFKKEFTSAHVIQFPDLLTTIRQYRERRISEAAVKGINEKLESLLVVDRSDKKRVKTEHMQSVRKAKGAKQTVRSHTSQVKHMSKQTTSPLHTACPKCNGQITLKTGGFGEFFGCSNYPDCRYTEKVNAKRHSV